MLADHPIDPMILATDLDAAREFYGERIGLEVLIESEDFLTFTCGGDSRLVVTRSSSGTTEQRHEDLDNWVNLNLVETRAFPDGVLLTRYETRR
jgi:hypothetical protein